MALPPRTNLPDRVILGYWAAVRKFLQKNHNLEERRASKAIARYRAVLAKSRVGDIMYHAPISDTAEGIVTGGYVPCDDSGMVVKKPKQLSPSQPTVGILSKRKRRIFTLASKPTKSQKSTKAKLTKRRITKLPET